MVNLLIRQGAEDVLVQSPSQLKEAVCKFAISGMETNQMNVHKVYGRCELAAGKMCHRNSQVANRKANQRYCKTLLACGYRAPI